jgi:putative ABC transport system permease protein
VKLSSTLRFASRLALRQLLHDRNKLFAATLGVMFATVLVFMQMGFRDALMDAAASAPKKMVGDIFILHRQTEALWRTDPFDRRELMRTLSHPEVAKVTPMYIGMTPWKNPENQSKRTLMVYGVDPHANVFNVADVAPFADQLSGADTVLFDRASRPEFGPVAKLLAEGPLFAEINDRRVEVVGVMLLGTSFAADGNVITSDTNFFRIFAGRSPSYVDLGIVQLAPGSDPVKVKPELEALLDENVHVFTYADLVTFEKNYWSSVAPIGFIFGMGVVVGLVVGMVIVYQILFTDITNHIREYATLKAMGYPHGFLVAIVFAASLILAVMGFFPGLVVAAGLYHLSESVIYIPMPLPLAKILSVFAMILTMCFFSGVLAIRKLKSANPADMF